MQTSNPYLWLIALLLVLLAVGAVFAVSLLFSRQRQRQRHERERMLRAMQREGERRDADLEQLNRAMSETSRQLAELSGTLDARMEALTQVSDERLTEMRHMVGEKLDARLSESFKLVNGQLADVHKGLGEMRELAANVADLKKVLGNVKTRGVWGEVVLRNLLQELFAPEQYVENVAIPEGSATRVEFALKLPDREQGVTLLPIDSKFPQEDYVRLVEAEAAGDAPLRERCARQLERALLEQAKLIAQKYIRPPQTTDFALMFLPAEGLYAEAARLPGFIERLQTRYRILICGPSTLCALLTSLQMGFRSVELEQRSAEALKLFDELSAEFGRFLETITRTRQRLEQAQSELDAMEVRARKISKKLL